MVLFPAGFFSLYGRNFKRRRKIRSTNVCHDGLLVCDPCQLYQHCGAVCSGYPGDLLGLSVDMAFKLCGVSHLFLEIRLGTWA